MRALVTFYRDRLHLLDEKDLWCRALKDSSSETLISTLLGECQDPSIETPSDYILCLKKIVSLALLIPDSTLDSRKLLRQALNKTRVQGFWKELQLGEALYALGCHLLDMPSDALEPKQLLKGGILLEYGHHLPDGNVPHLVMNAELALVWIYLGWKLEKEELLHAGLKWVHLAMTLFDHEDRPFHGIWLRESEYQPLAFITLYALLFSAASHLLADLNIERLALALSNALKGIDEEDFKNPPCFLLLMAEAFDKLAEEKKKPEVMEKFSCSEVDETLGFLSTRRKEISFVCTYSGASTGIGALHKSKVCIVSFGPHFLPLADSDRYGVHRGSSHAPDPFRDLKFEKKGDSFEVKGWTRLISPFTSEVCNRHLTMSQPGASWLFFSARSEEEKMILESRLSQYDEAHPLYFAYFISADLACIQGERPLRPGTLNRYEGPSSSIYFERGEERMTVTPKTEADMHVIPLAGKHHFWSADFLLAFPFSEQTKSYAWEIH